jgi:hypothetical protein
LLGWGATAHFGYKNNRPKLKKAEKELIDKGITPETSGWTERAKEWFYGVGDSRTQK